MPDRSFSNPKTPTDEQVAALNAAWEAIKQPLLHRHAYVTKDGVTENGYLATSCLHDDHDYCKGIVGAAGRKVPAQCKFCEAPCQCPCHG